MLSIFPPPDRLLFSNSITSVSGLKLAGMPLTSAVELLAQCHRLTDISVSLYRTVPCLIIASATVTPTVSTGQFCFNTAKLHREKFHPGSWKDGGTKLLNCTATLIDKNGGDGDSLNNIFKKFSESEMLPTRQYDRRLQRRCTSQRNEKFLF